MSDNYYSNHYHPEYPTYRYHEYQLDDHTHHTSLSQHDPHHQYHHNYYHQQNQQNYQNHQSYQSYQNHANYCNYYTRPVSAASDTSSIYSTDSETTQEPFEFERSGLRQVEEELAEYEQEKKRVKWLFAAVTSLAATAAFISIRALKSTRSE